MIQFVFIVLNPFKDKMSLVSNLVNCVILLLIAVCIGTAEVVNIFKWLSNEDS
jgi:hypothetical protein